MYYSLVDKDNPGVLILSPFAGAGDTMHEALRVNPYELGNVAQVQILVPMNKMKTKNIDILQSIFQFDKLICDCLEPENEYRM